MAEKNYWLCKSEPDNYSIDDLKKDERTPWDGVRNYGARNYMRDHMRIGDLCFFYHSNIGKEIVGIVEVIKEAYIDKTDQSGRFVAVTVKFIKKLERPISLENIKKIKELSHLSLIKQNTGIPILRKDFIIDEYQIFESKVYQADIILLIVSVLSDDQLKRFLKIAEDLQLDVIIETHDEQEVERAMKLNYPIIGINNRNLKNLKTDVNNSANLFTSISKDFTVIAESGIKSSSDIAMYNELGIFNFLIGESILKSNDYSAFIKTLLNNG